MVQLRLPARWGAVGVLALLAVVGAGCTGGDDATPSATASATAAPATVTVVPLFADGGALCHDDARCWFADGCCVGHGGYC